MNVISLFDGISCGKVALERAGIIVKEYYSYEINKSAIEISNKNHPSIIQMGDVHNCYDVNYTISVNDKRPHCDIDLVIGGSPCQDLRPGRNGLEGSKSKLFFEYLRVLRTIRPPFFLFENVGVIKKNDFDIVTSELGVHPIRINSALVSAQNRDRWYWTNIPNVTVPEDLNIFIDDIIPNAKGAALRNQVTSKGTFAFTNVRKDRKSNCVVASYVNKLNGCIIDGNFRPLTVSECEQLQTLPIGYTDVKGLSENQRKIALGNAWTVDVIAHILKNLNTQNFKEKDYEDYIKNTHNSYFFIPCYDAFYKYSISTGPLY